MSANLLSGARPVLGLGAIAALVLSTPVAHADVDAAWADPTLYTYEISHIPDFDQKRTALPNDGRAYCTPTASVNWAAYFANHGLPELPPGPGLWQARYNDATAAIAAMAGVMQTDAFDGTGVDHAEVAIWAWFNPGRFVVSSAFPTWHWTPTFHEISQPVFQGGYLVVNFGYYLRIMEGVYVRDGGHSLSLASGARSGDSMIIGVRDPWSDEGDWTRESPFSTEEYAIEHRYIAMLPMGIAPRWASRIVGYGDNTYLDSCFIIRPLFAVTSQPDLLNSFRVLLRRALWGEHPAELVEFETPLRTEIVDFALHPDLLSYLCIAESRFPDFPPDLWRIDAVSGEAELIRVPMRDPSAVYVSRRRDAYVLDGADLVMIDMDGDEPQAVDVRPPHPCDAITYDDDADEVVLLSVGHRELMTYPHHLDIDPTVRDIPVGVPLGRDARMAWDASRDAYWVLSAASDSLYMLTVDPFSGRLVAEELTDPALTDPRDLDVDDSGHVFVSNAGRLLEFEELEGVLPRWRLVEDPYFGDVETGDFLRLARSHSNFDPQIHGGPEWRNVPPTEHGDPIVDCPADLDDDGAVAFGDLLVVLTGWGPCPDDEFCHADLDYSGAVEMSDIVMLLAAWGPCP